MPADYRPPRRHAYVLIYWEERGRGPDAPGVWRFSLEDAHTHERRGFASFEALVAYLQQELARGSGAMMEGPPVG